jgi:hypothetical protein
VEGGREGGEWIGVEWQLRSYLPHWKLSNCHTVLSGPIPPYESNALNA